MRQVKGGVIVLKPSLTGGRGEVLQRAEIAKAGKPKGPGVCDFTVYRRSHVSSSVPGVKS